MEAAAMRTAVLLQRTAESLYSIHSADNVRRTADRTQTDRRWTMSLRMTDRFLHLVKGFYANPQSYYGDYLAAFNELFDQ